MPFSLFTKFFDRGRMVLQPRYPYVSGARVHAVCDAIQSERLCDDFSCTNCPAYSAEAWRDFIDEQKGKEAERYGGENEHQV